jgi:hypothetical protein
MAMVALGAWLMPASAGSNSYKVTKLVSDQANKAVHQDPNLVNAWGLVAGPSTPWWVANNHSNTSTLYDGSGNAVPLVVKVTGAPTGAVDHGVPCGRYAERARDLQGTGDRVDRGGRALVRNGLPQWQG